MDPKQRPLSPHLQIYKPQLTSILSITHRLTGILLTIGLFALAFWVIALAAGEQCFTLLMDYLNSWVGKVALSLWVMAFFYHLGNGLRHLFWDAGYGLELTKVYAGGWAVILFTLLGTVGFLIALNA
jgi:succinate dehydrogenase / fumarate reductase cytochrome b subunit